jgi:hypothetical protein
VIFTLAKTAIESPTPLTPSIQRISKRVIYDLGGENTAKHVEVGVFH